MPQPTTHDRHMITPYTLLSPTATSRSSLITVPVTLTVAFCTHIYSPLYE
ncbi:hypothetical protein P692DRAFT_201929494 [Suillus brevipes Sb2]|nr:hypothetical protein P692DRAFT_201929494 [Suillus brevipes Sb2]